MYRSGTEVDTLVVCNTERWHLAVPLFTLVGFGAVTNHGIYQPKLSRKFDKSLFSYGFVQGDGMFRSVATGALFLLIHRAVYSYGYGLGGYLFSAQATPASGPPMGCLVAPRIVGKSSLRSLSPTRCARYLLLAKCRLDR